MPEKTALSLASPMEEEDMENCASEKKITNLTKVRFNLICRASSKVEMIYLLDELITI